MTKSLRSSALASIAVLMLAACSGGASPSAAPSSAPSAAPSSAASEAPSEAPSAAPTVSADSLLGKILAAGKIRISTDPNYAPVLVPSTPATGKYTGLRQRRRRRGREAGSNAELGTNLTLEWQDPELVH